MADGFIADGQVRIGRFFGAPIWMHWSIVLGCWLVTGGRLDAGRLIGFVTTILVHEVGHALLVERTGQRIIGLHLHGAGGFCEWRGEATSLQRALVAWGGVWAQLALFLIASTIRTIAAPRDGNFAGEILYVLTDWNLTIALINLLPVAGLDGKEAWRLPRLGWKWWKSRRKGPKGSGPSTAERELLRSTLGDHEVVDRLIEFERRSLPNGSREQLAAQALARLRSVRR